MRDIQRFIRKKINKLKKRNILFRKKPSSINYNLTINKRNSFQYIGFYECERFLPSSNKGLLLYNVQLIEYQTPEIMLEGFQRSFTPMDLSNDSNGMKITWIELLWRGQIPLYEYDHQGFHIPKRLKQTLNNSKFTITVDQDFQSVIAGCASTTGENRRDLSWINREIRRLMIELYHQGYAHSVEVWQDEKLVGGLYGVSLGGYFTIESQFSFVKDTSKIALVHLVARLRLGGYHVLDIDEITSHLVQFGAYELSRNEFLQRMKEAVKIKAIWLGNDLSSEIIQNEIHQLGQLKTSKNNQLENLIVKL